MDPRGTLKRRLHRRLHRPARLNASSWDVRAAMRGSAAWRWMRRPPSRRRGHRGRAPAVRLQPRHRAPGSCWASVAANRYAGSCGHAEGRCSCDCCRRRWNVRQRGRRAQGSGGSDAAQAGSVAGTRRACRPGCAGRGRLARRGNGVGGGGRPGGGLAGCARRGPGGRN